jgi:hypothetical protein
MKRHTQYWIGWLAVLATSAGTLPRVEAAVTYAPEPALSSLLKGSAEQGKAAAAWVAAQARVIQARAQATQANAQALQLLETARTTALENEIKAATNYFEKRRLYETQREMLRGPQRRPAPAATAATPPQAATRVVQPATGRVLWPPALLQQELLSERVELETLFAARSRQGTYVSAEVRAAVERMKRQLRGTIRQVPPRQYVEAKRFLDALAVEVQRPAPQPRLAGR